MKNQYFALIGIFLIIFNFSISFGFDHSFFKLSIGIGFLAALWFDRKCKLSKRRRTRWYGHLQFALYISYLAAVPIMFSIRSTKAVYAPTFLICVFYVFVYIIYDAHLHRRQLKENK